MGLYIKGMEMPSKCIRCPVNVYGRCLVNDDKDVSKATADAVRDKDCPLVEIAEPHGRLIDGDGLIAYCKDFADMYKDSSLRTDKARRDELLAVIGEIINMPIVVRASGEED